MTTHEVHITVMLSSNARDDVPAHHVIPAGEGSKGYWRIDRDRNLLIIRMSKDERYEYPIENIHGLRVSIVRPEADAATPPSSDDHHSPEHRSEPGRARPDNAAHVTTESSLTISPEVASRLEHNRDYRLELARGVGTVSHGKTFDAIVHNADEDFSSGLLVWLI